MKPEEIGSYLKKLRLEHNLTQKELAKELHITHQAVSSWEKGKSLPDINTLSMLGDFYGITIDNLLLKEAVMVVTESDVVKQKKPMVIRRVFAFVGIAISLFCILTFFQYASHIVTQLSLLVVLLILSVLYSYIMKETKKWIEYGVITFLLVIMVIVSILSRPGYYWMNETNYMMLRDSVEIEYPREFDEETEVVLYEHALSQYALIYTRYEKDIDLFDIYEYQTGTYGVIDTGDFIVLDLIVRGEAIYFSTFNEEIPGEFKLFKLDFETFEYEVIYESQEVLRMYHTNGYIHLISDPLFESNTKIYIFDELEIIHPPVEVDFPIYYFTEATILYNTEYVISTMINGRRIIGVFDYDFELQNELFEEKGPFIHTLESNYGHTVFGKDGSLFILQETGFIEIETGTYTKYPTVIDGDTIRVSDQLYRMNYETEEYELQGDALFYSNDYQPETARFLIPTKFENYVALDNQFIGLLESVPYEIDDVKFESTTRIIGVVIGVFTYGFFITLGHKRKQ